VFVIGNPLGASGVAAEAAIARLCLQGLPALELFERAAGPLRRAVPYSAGCWKTVDPRTLLYTSFGIEDGRTGVLTAARWRFIDNELLEPDYGKYHELARRPTPVSTLHRDTHGEPGRSSRYRYLHRWLGFGAELRAVFRAGGESWGHVALIRGESQPDFTDQEVAFIARVGAHLGHGLRGSLLREAAAAGPPERAPGVIVLGQDGSVRSVTDQARFLARAVSPRSGDRPGPAGGGARGRPPGASATPAWPRCPAQRAGAAGLRAVAQRPGRRLAQRRPGPGYGRGHPRPR
jgi:hypothetical protein